MRSHIFYFHGWLILLSLQPLDYPWCHKWHWFPLFFFFRWKIPFFVYACAHTHSSLSAFLLVSMFPPLAIVQALQWTGECTHMMDICFHTCAGAQWTGSAHIPLRQWFTSFRSTLRCGSYGSLIFNNSRICLTVFYHICWFTSPPMGCQIFLSHQLIFHILLITYILTGLWG